MMDTNKKSVRSHKSSDILSPLIRISEPKAEDSRHLLRDVYTKVAEIFRGKKQPEKPEQQ